MATPPDTADRAARVLALVGAVAVILISATVLADVLMRWLFNAPVLAIDDLTGLNMAVAVVLCLPAGMTGRHFVTIRFLGHALGPRATLWLELFGAALTLAFFAALAWQFAILARDAAQSGLGSMVLQVPQAPWWWTVTAVLALAVPFQLVVVLRASRRVRAGR
ncbi:MAG TPA: TRAP transporter small permease subunit [Stellaceae bacterium]|nr:TRAP transporter small permease subunit [Stellaceae bacterium]